MSTMNTQASPPAGPGATVRGPLASVAAAFPHRARQIASLDALLSSDGRLRSPLPIFIHGAPATGKSLVLNAVAHAINTSWPHHAAYVSCRSAYSLKLVLSKVVRQWTLPSPSVPQDYSSRSIDTLCAFIQAVPSIISPNDTRQRWIILDDAHFLLDTQPALVKSLAKAAELTKRNLVLVLASSRDWRSFSSLQPILPIPFTPYSKADLVSILCASCHTAAAANSTPDSAYHPTLLRIISEALVDSVRQYCTNLVELQSGMAHIMPKAQHLLDAGTVKPSELHRIFRHLSKEFGLFASTLYTGHTAPPPPPPKRSASDAALPPLPLPSSSLSSSGSTALVDHTAIDLPLASKYLLIAAYLASYNPVSLDRQFFAKAHDSSIKRRRVPGSTGSKSMAVSQQLLGPRTFALDRMLAIFHAIVNGEIDHSVDVLHQVATLVALKYLTKVSSSDGLDGFKCKCNVSLDVVMRLAQACKFDLGECLADPHQV